MTVQPASVLNYYFFFWWAWPKQTERQSGEKSWKINKKLNEEGHGTQDEGPEK